MRHFLMIPLLLLSNTFAWGASPSTIQQDPIEPILEASDQRHVDDPSIIEGLKSSNRAVIRASIRALGEIGAPHSVPQLVPFLSSSSPSIREETAFALGLIGIEDTKKHILDRLIIEKAPHAKSTMLIALARLGNQDDVPFFWSTLSSEVNDAVLQGASEGLGILWLKATPEWPTPSGLLEKLANLLNRRDAVATKVAFALARYRGPFENYPVRKMADALGVQSSGTTRALTVRAIGKVKTAEARAVLMHVLRTDPWAGSRVEAVRALGNQPVDPLLLSWLQEALRDSSTQVICETLASIGKIGPSAAPLATSISELYDTSSSVALRTAALSALVATDAQRGGEKTRAALSSSERLLRLTAIRELGALAHDQDIEFLISLAKSDDLAGAAAAIESLGKVQADSLPGKTKEALKVALSRSDATLSAVVADFVETHQWKEFADLLAPAYDQIPRPDDMEARVTILSALGAIGNTRQLSTIETALGKPDRAEVVAAASAYKAITGVDVSERIPVASRVENMPTPAMEEITKALDSRVLLITDRGTIELEMLREAPVTAAYFVRLVNQGFYDGLDFHRVVPNFVCQGGDPRGDGSGGPGFLIRDEFSQTSHERGIVGMASAGKDTAGSQFFINQGPNLHLDWQYTAFARVVRGMNVVDALEMGDRIIRAQVVLSP